MYKTHRRNHNFQILYFLAGACHTPDGAYAMLCDLREERQMAIEGYKVAQIRQKAKEERTKRLLESSDICEKWEAEADLLELNNNRESGEVLYQAALDELAFIDRCIAAIQPYRIHANLPDVESHEAAQQEEWKLELIQRAENHLITIGTIPADHLATMRMHPEFATSILPVIDDIQELMKMPNGRIKLMQRLSQRSTFIPKLLEGGV